MMTKTDKTVIFFINMRILRKCLIGQLSALLCLFALSSCIKKEEITVMPPVTSPLSKEFIGFGVIKDSFTHIKSDPGDDSASLGYLRRGSLVKIVRRQTIKSEGNFNTWVLTDGAVKGWLKEDVMDIFDNESQAKTASESLSK